MPSLFVFPIGKKTPSGLVEIYQILTLKPAHQLTLHLSVLTNIRSTVNYCQPGRQTSYGVLKRSILLTCSHKSVIQVNVWKSGLEKDFDGTALMGSYQNGCIQI